VEGEPRELVAHGGFGARQKTRAHAVGHFAEAKVEARGLDLPVLDRRRAGDLARGDELPKRLARQNAGPAERALAAISGEGPGVFW
jgi:hypothetical protein